MVDLTADFWQAVTVTWACFGMGVAVFHLVQRSWFSVWLSRGLLALCPLVWTCWGVHAVRVNQQLAIMVEAKQSQGVDDVRVVQLAATNVVESRGGRRYERCEYTDGTRASWMRDISGRTRQLTDELDTICDRIDFNLEQLWICRQAKAQAFGGIEPGRVNMTRQSISGAQRLLQTARSRVHQVIGEIEIVSKPPQQQATANE